MGAIAVKAREQNFLAECMERSEEWKQVLRDQCATTTRNTMYLHSPHKGILAVAQRACRGKQAGGRTDAAAA